MDESYDFDAGEAALAHEAALECRRFDEDQQALSADPAFERCLAGVHRKGDAVAIDPAVPVADFVRALVLAGLILTLKEGSQTLVIVRVKRTALPAPPFGDHLDRVLDLTVGRSSR